MHNHSHRRPRRPVLHHHQAQATCFLILLQHQESSAMHRFCTSSIHSLCQVTKVLFYKGQVKALMEIGSNELVVNFDHVLKENPDLACTICDGKGRDLAWLKRAANLFLNENGFATDQGKISFSHLATSLKRGRGALSSPDVPNVWPNKLYKGEAQRISPSFHGAQKYDAVIAELLTRHANGESFCGNLTLDDILFLENEKGLQALITKEPEVSDNASREDKVLDIQGIWPMMEPFFTWDGQLPIYFLELKDDLLNVTADIVDKDWFHEYLRYHPALMPSMGRRHIECGLHQILKDFNFARIKDLESFFTRAMDPDWRILAGTKRVLDYRKPKPQTEKDGETKKVAGLESAKGHEDQKDIPEKSEGLGKGGSDDDKSGKGKKEKHEKVKGLAQNGSDGETEQEQGGRGLAQSDLGTEEIKIQQTKAQQIIDKNPAESRENSIWGLLGFKRNNHHHPKSFNVHDLDETEMFTADLFGVCLTTWIKVLLRKRDMSGKLAGAWSLYKASKSNSRRLAPY